MSQAENKEWTVKGAISVLAVAPHPGGDMVFAPSFETLKSAVEFLDAQVSVVKPSEATTVSDKANDQG